MKVIITLILIGSTMRIPVQEEATWLRDTVGVVMLLAGMVLPFGDCYGLMVITTLIVFAFINMLYNIRYDKFKLSKVKELENVIKNMNYYSFNLQEEVKRLIEVNMLLKKYKEENLESARIIVNELYSKYLKEQETDSYCDEELFNLLKEFKEILEHPIELVRSSYDMNIECKTKREKKIAIRRIRNIKKEYDLGKEFDMQLDEMIAKLKKELE